MKKAAILIKEQDRQLEGLRVSVGLLLENVQVKMFVLEHEIEPMDDSYRSHMNQLDGMQGVRCSNNVENVKKYGFKYMTIADIAREIGLVDVVIPV